MRYEKGAVHLSSSRGVRLFLVSRVLCFLFLKIFSQLVRMILLNVFRLFFKLWVLFEYTSLRGRRQKKNINSKCKEINYTTVNNRENY